MVTPTKDVTVAELAILEQLWEHDSAAAKELSLWRYGSAGPSDIATVQKLLSRLEAKECVTRDRDQWPHLFCAAITREDLIARRLQATANELSDGTIGSLITHLVQANKLNARQRDRLRKMLDEMDKK